jgi:hypothetical protein
MTAARTPQPSFYWPKKESGTNRSPILLCLANKSVHCTRSQAISKTDLFRPNYIEWYFGYNTSRAKMDLSRRIILILSSDGLRNVTNRPITYCKLVVRCFSSLPEPIIDQHFLRLKKIPTLLSEVNVMFQYKGSHTYLQEFTTVTMIISLLID